ncbi:MAG: hypothetical protein H6828_12690 [Planctomycetes bacterium]|nr:hypothetical protein [Planctomycetota bacterium]
MKLPLSPLVSGAVLLFGASALAQVGPDITVLRVAGTSNDIAEYGTGSGYAAYSFGTTSCNPGTQVVQWTNADHPVIGQNFFRLKDGRFEQIGQSWLKHGFCAVNESGCGSCQSTPCDTLGLGCADTYGSGLNDGKFGGPKYLVNANTGIHSENYPSPSGDATIRGRLQVLTTEIDPALNAGAIYFAEGQYVSANEYLAGNGKNSVSWRRINVNSVTNVTTNGSTIVGQAAPHAWKSIDNTVTVREVFLPNEGGAGVHGHFVAAYNVVDLGGGVWRYNYVVENLTSDLGAESWTVPVPGAVVVSNVYFRDAYYHSGEIQDNVDWTFSNTGGNAKWQLQVGSNNILKWGTMYSFGFDATAAPQAATGVIDIANSASVVNVDIQAPSGASTTTGTVFCSGDGSGTACPCNNHGGTAQGCQNSSGLGASLTATGTASVSGDSVVLNCINLVSGQPGLLFQGTTAVNGGNGVQFGDGLRCAGGSVIRLQVAFANGSGQASSSVPIALSGSVNPGDTMRYQFWYRDPQFSPCLNLFNLSNGLEISWQP